MPLKRTPTKKLHISMRAFRSGYLQTILSNRRIEKGIHTSELVLRSKCLRNFASSTHRAQFTSWTPSKWIIGITGALVIYGSWLNLWPHHKYPRPVAKKLREAIREETINAEHNYKRARELYQEALAIARSMDLEELSDEFTGIEFKLAEMYEKLADAQGAKDIYEKMVGRYFIELVSNLNLNSELRTHYIQRDLRALIKWTAYNSDPKLGMELIRLHLKLAEQQILSRAPDLSKLFAKKRDMQEILSKFKDDDLDLITHVPWLSNKSLREEFRSHSSAWQPFIDEIFTLRDSFVQYCLLRNEVQLALKYQMESIGWMFMADVAPGQILFSQTNLAGLLYHNAELLELDYNKKIRSNESKIPGAVSSYITNYSLSKACYQSVIDFGAKVEAATSDIENNTLDPYFKQSIALANYGLGVIAMHEGQYSEAKNRLSESLRLARKYDMGETVNEASIELDKLSNLIRKQSVKS